MSAAVFVLAGETYLVRGGPPEEMPGLLRGERPAAADRASDRADVIIDASAPPARRGAGARAGVEALGSGRWRLSDELVEAEISRDLAHVELRCASGGLEEGVRAASRLVAILRCVSRGGLVLHASGVELEGRAFLFTGPPGCGKSTAAAHAREEFGARGLADDTAFVSRSSRAPADGWLASGLPWEPASSAEGSPLGGVVRLRPGREFIVERLEGARAVAALVALPGGALGTEGSMLVAAAELVEARTPVFRAELPPGPEAVGRLLEMVCSAAPPEAAERDARGRAQRPSGMEGEEGRDESAG